MRRTRPSPPARTRRAVTVLELLVVLAVVGVLLALLLPAISASRAAARRVACADGLRQAALATVSFAQSEGRFPATAREAAPFRLLAPRLELTTPGREDGWQTPAVLACPGDGLLSVTTGQISYRFNDGTAAILSDYDGTAAPFRGRPSGPQEVSLADVTDGLSQTAILSERLADGPPDGRRGVRGVDVPGQLTAEGLLAACPAAAGGPSQLEAMPRLRQRAGYVHGLPPNADSCYDMQTRFNPGNAAVAATSLHGGGVNVAFGDGRVTMVGNEVDAAVWRAAGTRAGGELTQ